MSVIGSNVLAGASGQSAGGAEFKSLRFTSGDSAYLSRTPSSAGNRKTWTWSGWVKRSAVGTKQIFFGVQGTSDTTYVENYFATDDKLYLRYGYSSVAEVRTTQVFRDVSAWMHIVIAFDVTQSSDTDKLRLYINGSQVDDFSTDTRSSFSNQDYGINRAGAHKISGAPNGSSDYLDAYLADVHFIDGQALAPTNFGATDSNGVWQLIEYAGTYGTNGFRLDFKDNSSSAALGTDTSSNSNTWTVNNLSVAAGADNDSLADTPTNGTETDTGAGGEVAGNYATMNPLDKDVNCVLSNGNLDVSCSTAGWFGANATIEVIAGKTYFEATYVSGSYVNIGLNTPNTGVGDVNTDGVHLQNDNGSWKVRNGSSVTSISAVSANSVIGVAVDTSANTIQFFVNGSSVYSGTLNALHRIPLIYGYGTYSVIANFGQRAFAYTAPSGFKALCTANLPDPTISDPSQYFDTKLWTGNSSTQTISGYGFSPDFAWIKVRSEAGRSHFLFDTIRGATNALKSDATDAQQAYSTSLTAFNSDGFDLGAWPNVNNNAQTIVGWAWDAGTSTVTNNDGSVASQVRANPSAGFSIITATMPSTANLGCTVGHGLNTAPAMYVVKDRDLAISWGVYHEGLSSPSTEALQLNTAAAAFTTTNYWKSTSPTSSVLSLGTSIVSEGNDFVVYAFAPVANYSQMGSYVGNGSANGPFVHTGFKPRYLLVKCSSAIGRWIIRDTARDTYNSGTSAKLAADRSEEENNTGFIGLPTQTLVDFLSNGFKVRSDGGNSNDNGVTYIYIAFAENPFQANGGLAR